MNTVKKFISNLTVFNFILIVTLGRLLRLEIYSISFQIVI